MTEMPNHYGVQAPVCPFCKTRITIHQTFNPGHCGTPDCRHRHAAAAAKLRNEAKIKLDRKRRDAALRQGEEARPAIAAALEADPDAILMAIVPYQNNPIVPLPTAARDAFLAHLEMTVAAAHRTATQSMSQEPIEPPQVRTPRAVEEAGCMACQGSCCREGRDTHAFLSQSCLEDIVRANPVLSADDVMAVYVGAIPEMSVENACIYQTGQGCNLPRNWRSETCNAFKCAPLRQLSELVASKTDCPIGIIAYEKGEQNIMAHRDTRGTMPIPANPSSD